MTYILAQIYSPLFYSQMILFLSGKNLNELESQVNNEMKKVHEWLKDNELSLNLKKTNYIIFKTHKKSCQKKLFN